MRKRTTPSPAQREKVISGITDSEIHALLAERREIAVIWSVEDVQSVRPDLDEDQCWDVLQAVEHWHDCNYGITWDHLKYQADSLFGSSPEPSTGDHDE